MTERGRVERGQVHDDFYAFGLDALHDIGSEVRAWIAALRSQ